MKSLKSKKKAGTSLVLLCQLRIAVEQYEKAYSHRPIKIPLFQILIQNSNIFKLA